jgi:glycosyltransferase involved in cell wall biosynthesis
VTTVPTVRILGTHGVPAEYGGFETAAQCVGLYLREQGWRVIVYCQVAGNEARREDQWHGLERVCIPESKPGWLGTAAFDLNSVRHVLRHDSRSDVCLTFGYNTGVFNLAQKFRRIPNVINMDGMEWTRRRWGIAKQGILLANERLAGLVGDVLIADHPDIAVYLSRHFGKRRVTTITYGAYPVVDAPTEPVRDLGLVPGDFATMICRPIPENSVEEIVTAWSAQRRGISLVVLGDFLADDAYHCRVRSVASDEVVFPGAIYDPEIVSALRFHSRLYMHGHTVGGTNPSLVEAMAAGNAVVAHDNRYNRWVARDGARYFGDTASLSRILDDLIEDGSTQRAMRAASRARFAEEFTWDHIGSQYDAALRRAMVRHGRSADVEPAACAEEDAR